MPFGKRTHITRNCFYQDGKWWVKERIGTKSDRLAEFYRTHKNIEFHEEFDGGDNPYISGCEEHLFGNREATKEEIERHQKETKEIEKENKERDERNRKIEVNELKKLANKLGYEIKEKK